MLVSSRAEIRVPGAYQVKQAEGGEVHVELVGVVDEELAAQIEREVARVVSALPMRGFSIVFVTTRMTECTMGARTVLVRLQQVLARRARRTAYFDDRPRFRGIALWIMHMAEDRNAKAVATPEQMRHWLESDVGRAEDAQARAEGNP